MIFLAKTIFMCNCKNIVHIFIYRFQRLGGGNFGDVFLGTLSGSKGKVRVAVKKPKNRSDSNDQKVQRDLLSVEMKMMAYLQERLPNGHENVLRLVGAATRNIEHFCILTEYCEWGSLDNFLRNKFGSEKYVNEVVSENIDNNEQSARQAYKVWVMP